MSKDQHLQVAFRKRTQETDCECGITQLGLAFWRYFMIPLIEAAGSIENAVRLGILGRGDEADLARDMCPRSLGGRLKGKEIEKEWAAWVKFNVKVRELDFDTLRRQLAINKDEK